MKELVPGLLSFDQDRFAWREDLNDTVIVYQFGGSRFWVLRGQARKGFLKAIALGVGSDSIMPLIHAGVLTPIQEPL